MYSTSPVYNNTINNYISGCNVNIRARQISPNRVVKVFDKSKCFIDLYHYYKMKHKVSAACFLKSFINVIYKANIPENIVKIANEILVNPHYNYGSISDSLITLYFDNSNFYNSKGNWMEHNGPFMGDDVFSLIARLTGASDNETFQLMAKKVDVDLSKQEVIQIQELQDYSCIINPMPYIYMAQPSNHLHLLFEIWPMGKPITVYKVLNRYGSYSFDILEFIYDGQVFILLCTYQQNVNNYFDTRQELIAPSEKSIIMNHHLMLEKPENTLIIFDDPFMAYNFNSDTKIGLWIGDNQLIKQADLTFLKNRQVSYCFDKYNPNSMKSVNVLLEKSSELGLNIKLYPISEDNVFSITSHDRIGTMKIPTYRLFEIRNEIISSLNVNMPPEMSEDEYHETAESLHGLRFYRNKSEMVSISSKIEELTSKETAPVELVKGFFCAGELLLLAAGAKVGKSLFSGDIALLVACGGSNNRFSAPEPKQVLLIDSEMSPGLIGKRLSMLKKLYNNKHIVEQNIRVISLLGTGKRLDLLTETDRKWFEDQIHDAKFIIIDNLGGVMSFSAERNPEQWRVISTWLRGLCYKLKITILLVHHTNKAGTHRGTEKIKDDVDLMMLLNRPENCLDEETKFEVHFPHARIIGGPSRKGFIVQYIFEGESVDRIISNLDGSEMVSVNVVTIDEIKRFNLCELEKIILETARNKEFVVNSDFSDPTVKGRSTSTVTTHLRRLVDLNLLESLGSGSGTKYRAINVPLL